MKDRILGYLHAFARGENDALAEELKQELKVDDQTFQQNCAELRSEILHHYDQFSISTIDAFFQKVIRSFTRESHLVGDYRLEVDLDPVLEEVINNLIDELGDKPQLTKWIVEFAKENLENDRAWDVRKSLMEFAKEIFREEFKTIQKQVRLDSADVDFFSKLRTELWKVKNNFLTSVSRPALEVLQIIESKGWVDSDFYYGKTSGIKGFFNQFAFKKSLSSYVPPKDRMRNDFTIPKNWPSKTARQPSDIILVAEEKLVPNLREILSAHDNHFQKALSAEVALKNMYVFGLLADISRKLQDYKTENNLMLLAEAPEFLNGIIQESDTPFIYEKIGSFLRHYLIDEFQDTSGFQWKNFLPLLTNGLDQGYTSLVVGDVKQAIYRWRSGDLTLLQQEVENQIGKERVEIKELNRNYRSEKHIVNFNNAFFKKASAIVAAATGAELPGSVYHDVEQKTSKSEDGFVRISFLKDDEEGKWKEQALNQIPHHLERLQQMGVALSDIAILVRRNEEGQRIADHLLHFKSSAQALPDCQYDVVSNESLRMDGAATVNLLLGAMRYLLNYEDPIARAQLSFEYAKLHEPTRNQVEVFAVTNQVFFESQLPDAFTREKMSLRKLPLFELTETLIEIFNLGKERGELAYLQAFQDLVLEFYSRERNDLGSFLEWWEDNKHKEKTSIKVSGQVNAVKILTIHKAKGLEFRYVLIPFCSWFIDQTGLLAPNLWVKSEEALFSEAGYLPVNYSGTLDKTYFQKAYHVEKTRAYLDNLNLLYVAFTRAESGMIVTAPYKNKGTVAEWIHDSIQQNEEWRPAWNDASQELVLGDWNMPAIKHENEVVDAVELESYLSSRWRDKLVIRQAGASFFESISADQRKKINYGIHLHAVLSRIRYTDDVHLTMDRLVLEGIVAAQDKAAIRKQLDELLNQPVIARWFTPDWKVKTEVPILLPGGGESRIDRLMINGTKAIVVDFKTGEKSKADQKQVAAYMEILKEMHFTVVEGYLLYTRDCEVISVNDGKIKMSKKKDEHQLGLGF